MNWINEKQILENQKIYTNEHKAVKGCLGGIGTGNISIDTSARFCDFEIFNRPDKGLKLPYHFFSIWSKAENEKADTRILEVQNDGGDLKGMYHAGELMGLPRFSRSTFTCQYPFYNIRLEDDAVPLQIEMTAFTPFIPLDAYHSGLPGYQVKYCITNRSDKMREVSIAASAFNAAGFIEYDGFDRLTQKGKRWNKRVQTENVTGISFGVSGISDTDVTNGTLAIAAVGGEVSVKEHWQYGGWWDGAEEFWQDFSADGILQNVDAEKAQTESERCVGSVAVKQTLHPGETKEFIFYTSWHFPYRYGWWPDGHVYNHSMEHQQLWKNYYAAQWKNAWEVICYFDHHLSDLESKSRNFANALYSSSIGADVVESLVSSIHVLRSCTCFRIEDGTFFGWEGCFEKGGSCAGNCTHVWSYAQTLAYLFPELEQNMRRTEFLTETDETGNMAFRAKRKLEGKAWEMLPATDGQLGSILRVYREWKFSGEDDFLKELWEPVKRSLDFAIRTWDSDGDYVLDSRQHNTYDIEFYGITSMTNSVFYAALKAVAEMARYLGEDELAQTCLRFAARGSEKMDALLWNGSYYKQGISSEEMSRHSYQYGDGCLADQLFGQQIAHLYGLGYIFPKEHAKKAIYSVYQHNFLPCLKEHQSVQRNYALADEGGVILCSWPKGGRPRQPFVYSDEVWTGIEMQVAVHLIYEGFTKEAINIVKTVRNRYNGIRRNPFDEIECGYHYARSMASWGLLIALSGFRCHMPEKQISFSPVIDKETFSCFFSTGQCWGIYEERTNAAGEKEFQAIPLYGSLEGVQINGREDAR